MRRVLIVVLMVSAMAAGMSTPAAGPLPHRCDRSTGWPAPPLEKNPSPRIQRITIDGPHGLPERVNVLLPPGYDAPGNTRRYPVVYALHGGGWGPDDAVEIWTTFTPILELSAREPHAIVVFPYGGSLGFHADWRDGSQKWETFHIKTVIRFIDRTYRTIPDRAYRAVTGESMGGMGATIYAGRHPDLFVAAAPMSGAVDLTMGIGAIVGAASRPAAWCAGTVAPHSIWGNPATDEVWMRGHNPGDLASNYGGMMLNIYAGTGIPCDGKSATTEAAYGYTGIEAGIRPSVEEFARKLRQAGVPFIGELPACGMHSYHDINPAIERAWPRIMSAFGSQPRATFDFRAVEPRFSVYGWTFEADPERATEFLSVTDASCSGFGLTGSGRTRVTTARCFRPGSTVLVNGTPTTVRRDGRLSFTVDLGPAHHLQQYTPAANVLEAAGGYWASTIVRLERIR